MTAPVPALTAVNAAIIGQQFGNVYQGDVRQPKEFVLGFDVDTAAGEFVGREAAFAALTGFAANPAGGYFEIVGDAGLGKTALATQIIRRWRAVPFLASAATGVQRSDQLLTHVSATLIQKYDLPHATLPARAGSDATFLSEILAEALRQAPDRQIWIVVDGLDEADEAPPGANPLLLPAELPRGVFVVVTHRPGGDLSIAPGTRRQRYELLRDDPEQLADLRAFVRRAAVRPAVARVLARYSPPLGPEAFAGRLTEAGDGNFMYVSYVLADMVSVGDGDDLIDLADLPSGLVGYYQRFWLRMTAMQSSNWATWQDVQEPVLELLAVARAPVSADWLGRQLGRRPQEIRMRVLEPWTRLLSRTGPAKEPAWRLVHRTFAEFLADKLDLVAAHHRLAARYLDDPNGVGGWDEYGLRHVPAHLAEVARRSATPPAGHQAVSQLVALLVTAEFHGAVLDGLGDPPLLARQLAAAQDAAARDPHPDATFLLVSVAVTVIRLRNRILRPDMMFEAAEAGQLGRATSLLDLFGADLTSLWHDAILLSLAWLAAPAAPAEAAAVLSRLAGRNAESLQTERLWHLADGTLRGQPPPPAGWLPPAPSPREAEAIIARVTGSTDPEELHGTYDTSLGELFDSGYLASVDGPALVAMAAPGPGWTGDTYLDRYLDVHTAYGYRQYRDGSLWELLEAVLRHPDPDWVRAHVVRLGTVVLSAPDRGEFVAGLGIAVLARLAVGGDDAARRELDDQRDQALTEHQHLPSVPVRGRGDTWGTIRRRLAALAEAYHRVPGGTADAVELASAAAAVSRGFAGFSAPATLTVAETVSIVQPGNANLIQRCLDAALGAAQHIQDPVFCVRTTARVEAMRRHWWPTPKLVRETVDGLIQDPTAAQFAAVHTVGEQFLGGVRPRGADFRAWRGDTDSLAGLADLYQRPLSEFARLNPGYHPEEQLPGQAVIAVPDPGFPAILAARLSAEVVTSGLPDRRRADYLRQLVRVGGNDTTAQCTMLTRLLLAAPTEDPQLLNALRELVDSLPAD